MLYFRWAEHICNLIGLPRSTFHVDGAISWQSLLCIIYNHHHHCFYYYCSCFGRHNTYRVLSSASCQVRPEEAAPASRRQRRWGSYISSSNEQSRLQPVKQSGRDVSKIKPSYYNGSVCCLVRMSNRRNFWGRSAFVLDHFANIMRIWCTPRASGQLELIPTTTDTHFLIKSPGDYELKSGGTGRWPWLPQFEPSRSTGHAGQHSKHNNINWVLFVYKLHVFSSGDTCCVLTTTDIN